MVERAVKILLKKIELKKNLYFLKFENLNLKKISFPVKMLTNGGEVKNLNLPHKKSELYKEHISLKKSFPAKMLTDGGEGSGRHHTQPAGA